MLSGEKKISLPYAELSFSSCIFWDTTVNLPRDICIWSRFFFLVLVSRSCFIFTIYEHSYYLYRLSSVFLNLSIHHVTDEVLWQWTTIRNPELMNILRKWTAICHITSLLILQGSLNSCLSICKMKFLHPVLQWPLSLADFVSLYEIFSMPLPLPFVFFLNWEGLNTICQVKAYFCWNTKCFLLISNSFFYIFWHLLIDWRFQWSIHSDALIFFPLNFSESLNMSIDIKSK